MHLDGANLRSNTFHQMDRIKNFFEKLQQRIAFYPSLISLGGVFLAVIMVYLERQHLSARILDVAPSLVINDTATARILLSTFIAGLISLMVFSFSQVMLLLNQASRNFSPRVLPGIISDSRNQMVLGLYLGVILYNILILVYLEPKDSSYGTAGFSVLVGIVLTVFALSSFIFFIHHISRSIQVGAILQRTKEKTLRLLKEELKTAPLKAIPLSVYGKWTPHTSDGTGYFQDILTQELTALCKEGEVEIIVDAFKGQFITPGTTVFRSERPIPESLRTEMLCTFVLSQEEMEGHSYAQGFRQLTEIGIKAMSPGINDPGTALNSIDYLTELFMVLAQKKENGHLFDSDGKHWITLTNGNFKSLLYNVMATYRTYCSHDVIVVQKLLAFLRTLATKVVNATQQETVALEIENLLADAKRNIENHRDIQKTEEGFTAWS
jgi:uncharacterized membrane protein